MLSTTRLKPIDTARIPVRLCSHQMQDAGLHMVHAASPHSFSQQLQLQSSGLKTSNAYFWRQRAHECRCLLLRTRRCKRQHFCPAELALQHSSVSALSSSCCTVILTMQSCTRRGAADFMPNTGEVPWDGQDFQIIVMFHWLMRVSHCSNMQSSGCS